jgi:hypothetical protein
MRKRSSIDTNGIAFVGIEKVRSPKKNPAAVALGRLGGKKGGPARAERLTPERRSAIARTAALSRWEGKR